MRIIEAIAVLKHFCTNNDEEIRNELKLSPAELHGLMSLDAEEEISCQKLSKKMGLSISRGSRVISKLVKKGYFSENKPESDKRCINIKLSKEGKKVKVKIDDMMDKCEKRIMSKLKGEEAEETIIVLEKLIKIMQYE